MAEFMRTLHTFGCLVVAIFLAAGCAARRLSSLPPQALMYREVPIGLCEDYPKESRSLASARRDLELLHTNGIHVLRISFSWLDMEPEPGKYDWSFWDDFVRMAVDEYHARLIPYVCYTPRWASSSTNEDYWRQPPADNARFAEFITRLVARYKDRIHSWEIWNEPDNPYYWRGTVQQFAALLQTGARAVRQTDPTAKVVMGGLAWNPDFLSAVLADTAAISNVDVINLHNYYETWASDPLEWIPAYVGRADDLIHQHGQHQPIWLAEVGYSDFRQGSFVSDEYTAHFQDEHTPAAQAESLFRVMTLAFASGDISLVAWYRIHDLPPTQKVIGDENNRFLGIVDVQDRAKPALRALQFFDSLFPQGFRCLDNEIRVSKVIGQPVETHAFERPDGVVIVAAWLRTYVPGLDARAPGILVPDRRRALVNLRFPFATATRALVFDELGNPRGAVSTLRHGQSSGISNLLLEDGTLTVLEIHRAARS